MSYVTCSGIGVLTIKHYNVVMMTTVPPTVSCLDGTCKCTIGNVVAR